MAYLPEDPATLIETIALTGLYNGKVAYAYNIFGKRGTFNDTTSFHDIKEFAPGTNLIPVLAPADTFEVLSSSAADASAGTGIRTLKVTYIDDGTGALTETSAITMNGTTPVALGAGIHAKQILWMEAVTVGSNNASIGTITLRTVGAATAVEQISANATRSLSARFMVPTGYTGYLVSWGQTSVLSSAAAYFDTRIAATASTTNRTLIAPYLSQDGIIIASNNSRNIAAPMLKIPALANIKMSVMISTLAGTSTCEGSFTIVIIAN